VYNVDAQQAEFLYRKRPKKAFICAGLWFSVISKIFFIVLTFSERTCTKKEFNQISMNQDDFLIFIFCYSIFYFLFYFFFYFFLFCLTVFLVISFGIFAWMAQQSKTTCPQECNPNEKCCTYCVKDINERFCSGEQYCLCT
jgi:hypothetical protein